MKDGLTESLRVKDRESDPERLLVAVLDADPVEDSEGVKVRLDAVSVKLKVWLQLLLADWVKL